jgi:ribosomal protein S18 acetylase RimI-like enzyme
MENSKLSPALLNQISFAMQHLGHGYLFDWHSHTVVDLEDPRHAALGDLPELALDNAQSDGTSPPRYVPLPPWDSTMGFQLMNTFCEQLGPGDSRLGNDRIGDVRRELQQILHSRHNVFRRFKDHLKTHPLADRQWHSFRERHFRHIINQWYNDLRESWGMTPLNYANEYNYKDILQSEFVFGPAPPELYPQLLALDHQSLQADAPAELDPATAMLLVGLHRKHLPMAPDPTAPELIFTATSAANDLAGFSLGLPLLDSQGRRYCHLVQLLVLPEYRGLGIAQTLLDTHRQQLQAAGYHALVLNCPWCPPWFMPCLHRRGLLTATSPTGWLGL